MTARMSDALIAGASRSEFEERIHAIAMTQGVPRHALCLMGVRKQYARAVRGPAKPFGCIDLECGSCSLHRTEKTCHK